MKSVMKEPKICVRQDYSQLIAGLDHHSVGSGTGRGSNVRHATLRGNRDGSQNGLP